MVAQSSGSIKGHQLSSVTVPAGKPSQLVLCALKNTAGDSADDYLTATSSAMWGVSVGWKNCVFPVTRRVGVLRIHSDDALLAKPCMLDHTPVLKHYSQSDSLESAAKLSVITKFVK